MRVSWLNIPTNVDRFPFPLFVRVITEAKMELTSLIYSIDEENVLN